MDTMIVNFEKERKNAMSELKGVVGKECSENFSPTLRAKLVEYDEFHDVCIMEVVKSPYPEWSWAAQQNHTAGHRYKAPASRIWNAFFF
jgi:hypothetical protein